MTTTGTTTSNVTPITAAQGKGDARPDQWAPAPAGTARQTWKQLGQPQRFVFWDTLIKYPGEKGLAVAKVVVADNVITLKGENGRPLRNGKFGVATKFWASDVDEASKPAKADPKPKADKLPELVIDAPKGGDRKVAPIKGAMAKAIKASGKTISGIAREHGQNPSQLRRISLDAVAWVDLTRAESIAKAFGVPVTDLFAAPVDKGNGKAKATGPATTDPKPGTPAKGKAPRKSKAERAAEKARQDGAELAELAAKAEAEAAQDAAEGSQDTPGAE